MNPNAREFVFSTSSSEFVPGSLAPPAVSAAAVEPKEPEPLSTKGNPVIIQFD